MRDNFTGAGCTKEDNMVLTVSGAAGPFEVTVPNAPLHWTGNTNQTVTWNVAGSAGAPVNCANVKISLSIDGGWTYPTVILATTGNDGTQNITVPNTPSNNCRIKIQGVGNVFYDISNQDFFITAGLPVELLEFNARLKKKNRALLTWATASEKDNKGFEIQQATNHQIHQSPIHSSMPSLSSNRGTGFGAGWRELGVGSSSMALGSSGGR
ncbi:MAG: hypothetical protein H7246_05720 [Phycisphaerae bacterium]|nr:hypothetical protein [Saprospiraceae bacterium]